MDDWPQLTIGDVAHRAGLATSSIRYYESIGLLPEPDRLHGQRRYRTDVLGRLAFIGVAQSAGFKLDEIKALVVGVDGADGMAGRMRPLPGPRRAVNRGRRAPDDRSHQRRTLPPRARVGTPAGRHPSPARGHPRARRARMRALRSLSHSAWTRACPWRAATNGAGCRHPADARFGRPAVRDPRRCLRF